MFPTALIYSSHERSNYIHNDWIVQRALAGNKRILFLTLSEAVAHGDRDGRQQYAWGNFAWFFGHYAHHGLEAFPFVWNDQLRKEDVDQLAHELYHAEVVILGGGNPATGMWRYRDLGAWFYGDRDWFAKMLHERQNRGLLTVGFSAGCDQLGEYLWGAAWGTPDSSGFSLVRNVLARAHFDHSIDGEVAWVASRMGHCLTFGLPNDSGIAADQGWTPGGNIWQLLEFVVDRSWDRPEDAHHIKTREGTLIQHAYADGRTWAFNGGDKLLRIQSPDNQYCEAWILPVNREVHDYWTQQPIWFDSIKNTIHSH